jgi:hypothetical protein
MKIHIKDMLKKYKLNPKTAKQIDVYKKLEDTDRIVCDYEKMKRSPPKVVLKDIAKFEKKRIYGNMVVETNSNYYVRLKRDQLVPTIGK